MADKQVVITITDNIPPKNVATIDKDGMVGNTYTKSQFDQSFSTKINEIDTKLENIQQMVESDFKGTMKPTDAAPTEDGTYKPEISSEDDRPTDPNSNADWGKVYPNAGNLRAKSGYDTIFYKKGTVWTRVERKMPAASNKIETWQAIPYAAGVQVVDNDKVYESNTTTLSTDIPGASAKWIRKIGADLKSGFQPSDDTSITADKGIFDFLLKNKVQDFFNKYQHNDGYIKNDGQVQPAAPDVSFYSDFVPISIGMPYLTKGVLGTNENIVSFYDQNKTYVSGVTGDGGQVLKTIQDVSPVDGFVRFSTSGFAYVDVLSVSGYAVGNIDRIGEDIFIPGKNLLKQGHAKYNIPVGTLAVSPTDQLGGDEPENILIHPKIIEKNGILTDVNIMYGPETTNYQTAIYVLRKVNGTLTVIHNKAITLPSGQPDTVHNIDLRYHILNVKAGDSWGLIRTPRFYQKNDANGGNWYVINKNTLNTVFTNGAIVNMSFNANVEVSSTLTINDDKAVSKHYADEHYSNDYVPEGWSLTQEIRPSKKFNAENATKIGVILEPSGSTTAYDGKEVESPSVMWDENLQKYVMVFTSYSTSYVATIGWATSDDLIEWTKQGVLLQASGVNANGDQYGTTGPMLTYMNGIYYLYYIGLNGVGYEGEPINMCLATNTTLSPNGWSYKGIKVPIQTSIGWCNDAIYHPHLKWFNGKFYLFFNARGTVNGVKSERTGFATSDKIDGPWVVDPVHVSQFADQPITISCGDPAIIEYKGLLYMFYFSGADTNVVDRWAWTTKLEFPRGWKAGGISIFKSSYDSQFAHKPFIFISNGILYHYYTAVDANNHRTIALQTFDL